MTTFAYVRISTDKQAEKSQRQIIAEWSEKNGARIDEWTTDTASGSTPWQQRSIAGALDRARPGDRIIVSEISRIARSTVGVLTFLQTAAAKHVGVTAIKSGIALDDSPQSKIVVTVLAMAAEIERDLLRERTRAALQARKARGLTIGRQPGAKGRANKLDGKWQEIERLLLAKVPKRAIARILEVSPQTLHDYIKSKYGEKVARAQQTTFDLDNIPTLTNL